MTKTVAVLAGAAAVAVVGWTALIVGEVIADFKGDEKESEMSAAERMERQVEETRDKTRTMYCWAATGIVTYAVCTILDGVLDSINEE